MIAETPEILKIPCYPAQIPKAIFANLFFPHRADIAFIQVEKHKFEQLTI
jgi:hypothetical protein